MMDLWGNAIAVFMAFFAVMNPIANVAVFAGLVADKDRREQLRIAARAMSITFVIVVLFAVLGKTIFHLFGITLSALRITGGVLIFLVGYHMLHGSSSKLHTAPSIADADMAVSPLAVPVLAGPGTIATAMNYSASDGLTGITVTVISFSLLCGITFGCFAFSAEIMEKIGESGLCIITRLMGLILAVIGTQMLVLGIKAAFQIG